MKSLINLNSSPFPALSPSGERPMSVEPGSLVRIHRRDDAVYEVVSVEDDDLRCWVRRWPQARKASSPFPVPIRELEGPLQAEASR
jgi:hypothetical protein